MASQFINQRRDGVEEHMADFENQDGDSYRQGLRDSLLAAVDTMRDDSTGEEQAAATPVPVVPAETEAQAAQRARDEAGRFAKADTPQKSNTAPTAPAVAPNGNAPANSVPGVAPASLAPPSSWKKERHEAFAKLDPDTQRYILQRETEYNTGVSTYRAEAERAKVLHSALEPFLPSMQQYNVQPADWIRNVGQTHELLLKGSPQQKFQTIVGLARDYGVDLSPLTGGQPQGEAGQPAAAQSQSNPEIAWLRDQLSTLSQQVNSFTQQRQLEQQSTIQNEIQQFAADADKYPFFEVLRYQMAQLLESGEAQNLSNAYAIAFDKLNEKWQAQQAAERQGAEMKQRQQQAEQAARARAKVVSVKSATPSAAPAAATTSATDRRSSIAEAVSQHSGGGRV